MEVNNQSFEREFMQKVRGGADGGAKRGAATGGGARGKLDWKVLAALGLGGLILIGWVVWMVVGDQGGGEQVVDDVDGGGDVSVLVGGWRCEDGLTVEFSENGTLAWDTGAEVGTGVYEMDSDGKNFDMEGVAGVVGDGEIEIIWDTTRTTCRRSEL